MNLVLLSVFLLWFFCSQAISYENQSFFPFGFYSTAHNAHNEAECYAILKPLKDSGVTYLGPYYGTYGANQPICYHAAHNLSMKAFHKIAIFGEHHPNALVNFVNVNDSNLYNPPPNRTEIFRQVFNIVQAVVQDPIRNDLVTIWDLGPEELRSWRSDEMQFLSNVKEAIRESEKLLNVSSRPFNMYEPNNRDTEGLKMTKMKGLDTQMRGAYSDGIDDPQWVEKINYATDMIKGAMMNGKDESGIVLNLDRDYNSNYSDFQVFGFIRRACYTALLGGARSLLVWSWATRKGLSVAMRDKMVLGYSKVAYDLNGPSRLAEIFLKGTLVPINMQLTYNNQTTLAHELKANLYHYDGKLHLIALNTNNSTAISADFIFNGSISNIANRIGMKRVPFEIVNSTNIEEKIMRISLEPCEVGVWDMI